MSISVYTTAAAGTTHASKGLSITLHQGFASVVLLYSAILALWGLFLYVRGANPSGSFTGALIILEGVAVLQSLIGLVLLLQGHRPHDALHYIYGVGAVLTLPVAYSYSDRAHSRRDSLVFALGALVLVGIALRAATTGA